MGKPGAWLLLLINSRVRAKMAFFGEKVVEYAKIGGSQSWRFCFEYGGLANFVLSVALRRSRTEINIKA